MIFTFRVFTGALFFVGVAFLLRVVRFLTLVAFVRRQSRISDVMFVTTLTAERFIAVRTIINFGVEMFFLVSH